MINWRFRSGTSTAVLTAALFWSESAWVVQTAIAADGATGGDVGSFWWAFGIAVFAGLVTAGIVLVVEKYWASTIVPWYEKRVYSGARIEGTWEVEYPGDRSGAIEKAKLEQTAHRVEGTTECVEGPDTGKVFTIHGEFKNLILTLTYESLDKGSLDRGTYTLMLTNNGTTLVGVNAYYEDDKNAINKHDSIWTRTSD